MLLICAALMVHMTDLLGINVHKALHIPGHSTTGYQGNCRRHDVIKEGAAHAAVHALLLFSLTKFRTQAVPALVSTDCLCATQVSVQTDQSFGSFSSKNTFY